MKRTIKVIVLFILSISVMAGIINTYVNADYGTQITSELTSVDTAGDSTTASTSAMNIVKVVIVIARVIGVTVAITMLLVIAMKYMSAAPGEKADIKKSAVAYVVGAVVLFAVTGILGIVEKFATAITAGTAAST